MNVCPKGEKEKEKETRKSLNSTKVNDFTTCTNFLEAYWQSFLVEVIFSKLDFFPTREHAQNDEGRKL